MHCFVLYDGGITLECGRMAFIAFCNETSQNYIIIQVNKTERNCLNNTLWKSDATSREHIARTSLKSLSHPRIGSRTFAL